MKNKPTKNEKAFGSLCSQRLDISGVHRHFFELVHGRFRGFECFKTPYKRWYKTIIWDVFSCIVFIHKKLVSYKFQAK